MEILDIFVSVLAILLIVNIFLTLKAGRKESSNELTEIKSSVNSGIRSWTREKRGSASWVLLDSLKGDFGQSGAVLAQTKKKLIEAAYETYTLKFRARTIERKITHLKELQWNESELLFDYIR
jgi:hypothetical protein